MKTSTKKKASSRTVDGAFVYTLRCCSRSTASWSDLNWTERIESSFPLKLDALRAIGKQIERDHQLCTVHCEIDGEMHRLAAWTDS